MLKQAVQIGLIIGIQWSKISIGSMDFDIPKVYGDTPSLVVFNAKLPFLATVGEIFQGQIGRL